MRRLQKYPVLLSSELLLAEIYAYASRVGIAAAAAREAVEAITWIIPERSLQPELERVAHAGYLRGADLWHLACACYLSPKSVELDFLTCDQSQWRVADALGFVVPIYRTQ